MSSINQQTQFLNCVHSKLNPTELTWLTEKCTLISNGNARLFNVNFSLCSRFIKPDLVAWNSNEEDVLEQIYPTFTAVPWQKTNLARLALMLAIPTSENENSITTFFETAEMKEQAILYKGLYLLENATAFTPQVAHGIRTNIVDVFDAIASYNPYAQAFLDEAAWNQLILKSFFMSRPIYTIYNLDARKNEDLANMLQDYVKERWAAGRLVSLEIWRLITGFLRNDLKTIINNRTFEGAEKEILTYIQENSPQLTTQYWNTIGEKHH